MENQTDSHTPQKIYAGKLCFAAFISIILGISLFFIFVLLTNHVEPSFHSFEDVCVFGIYLSIVLICLVVPFLGLLAIGNILSNWQLVNNPDYITKNETKIRKVAYSFLITGLLFAAVSLLPVMFVNVRDLPGSLCLWIVVMASLALVKSCVSYKVFSKISVRILPRFGAVFGIILSFIAVAAVFLPINLGHYLVERIEYSKITESFSGESTSLKQTSIIPTFGSPCPENKNVIWCSSFQLAWNRIKDDVIGAPVEVVGADEIATRLNSAEQTEDDLEPYSYYAAAGRTKQGIINKIEKDMASKFPHSIPDFSDFADIPQGILAYAYLIANVPFKYPYRQVKDEFIFIDSNGVKTNVTAFGIWGYGLQDKRLRDQAEVLYFQEDPNERIPEHRIKEFAIDLCKHSRPYQVVAAMVEPKDSLARTFNYIQSQIEDFKKMDYYEIMRFLDRGDILKVPEMLWEIDHCFDELIGKIVSNSNPPMPIVEAQQVIKFRLDRYGASLQSESTVVVFHLPRYFMFNRPFLVYMKNRDCEQPFFVMWVDNTELLNKK